MSDPSYSVYILDCDKHILYTGIAINPQERLRQHQTKKSPGAKFTRRFNHLSLVYHVQVGNRSQAQRVEYRLRKKNRQTKLKVVKNQCDLNQLKTILSLQNL